MFIIRFIFKYPSVILSLISTLPSIAEIQAEERPNVIVFLADDQGWGDLSVNGNPNVQTPSIDSLAREGAMIENFYVCAVCSPTRAEFLTGRYHTRMGVFSTSTGGERFNSDEQTIAEVFQKAGYVTAAFGKWHSGMQFPYHPNARGFSDFYGFCSGHWGHYFSPMLERNGEIIEGEGFIIDDLTNQAMEFIKRNREQPFFVYLPYNTPHSPMQVPDQNWEQFKDKEIKPDPSRTNSRPENINHTRAALAMTQNIDQNVGRVLDCLEQLDLTEDTIVIYFSDNGPNGPRFNGGMRGRKGTTFEGGLRVPFLIRYPKKIQGGSVVKQVGGAIDLLPTLVDFASIEYEPRKAIDGVSLAPVLEDHTSVLPDRLLFSAWKNKASVRNNRFRLQRDGQLYDLDSDREELVDVAKVYPKIAEELHASLNHWLDETQSSNEVDPASRPITLGHLDESVTQLPARDAIPHGKVKRSNRFPNATYMLNWSTRDEDYISWDIEVLAEGDFEVELYYAAKDSDLGLQLELSFQDRITKREITQAHDVPLLGGEADRVVRQEGYVKRWAKVKLGEISLPAGHGSLDLRLRGESQVSGVEMRLLTFRRLSKSSLNKQ